MRRRVSVLGVVVATMLLGIVGGEGAASATTSLLLPQSTAFSILRYDCGGIQEQAFATGFDVPSGYPTGDVHLKTTCSAGGRGGHSTTITAWAGVMWDFTGAVISAVALSTAPSVNPTFSAFDVHGNEVYNQSNNAYLVLASGFVPAPRVTGMTPTLGPARGGTTVTITGTGFTGAKAVDFGGTAAASFTMNSDTSITAVSPMVSSAGTVNVTVTTAGGTDATSAIDQFTFYATPVVSSVSPNSGPLNGGTTVTITGANFTGATAVFFGDTQAGFFVNDDTSITAFSPGEGSVDSVDVTVTSPGGTSAITPADQFNYTTTASVCGNGIVESGEQCDDGVANGTASSCCTATCTFQPSGTPCTGGTCNGTDMCVPATTTTTMFSATTTTTSAISTTTTVTSSTSSTTSTTLIACSSTPGSGCQPAAARKAQLRLGTGKLAWKWTSSGAVATSDFGTPQTTTDYVLCIYGASAEKLTAEAPADRMCGTKPCWKALGTIGFTYADKTGTPAGLTKVLLKAGSAGRGKIGVNGSGANLRLPTLPLTTPVKVQLRQDGSSACWEATYSTATTNTGSAFRAKSD